MTGAKPLMTGFLPALYVQKANNVAIFKFQLLILKQKMPECWGLQLQHYYHA